jgi:hypothetical protein
MRPQSAHTHRRKKVDVPCRKCARTEIVEAVLVEAAKDEAAAEVTPKPRPARRKMTMRQARTHQPHLLQKIRQRMHLLQAQTRAAQSKPVSSRTTVAGY